MSSTDDEQEIQFEFCQAAVEGDLKKFMKVFSDKIDINQCDKNDRTPLGCAIRGGNIQIVEHVICFGADMNKECSMKIYSSNRSPLYWALFHGQLKISKMLVEHGANLTDPNPTISKLLNAVVTGKKKIVKSLLKTNIDVNQRVFYNISTLCWAALFGYTKIAILLVEAGADINFLDEDGYNPLIYAIRGDSLSTAIFLAMKGGKPPTLLQEDLVSIFQSISESVKIIHSLSVDERFHEDSNSDNFGNSYKTSNLAVSIYLATEGIDVNKVASLSKAVLTGYLNVVSFLIRHGCNVNEIDSDGNTPLVNAIGIENVLIIKKLIVHKVDICGAARDGSTALSEAVKLQNIGLIKFLLDEGAISTAPVFFNAIQLGNFQIVKLLAEKSAVINFISKSGQTPLTKAVESGHVRIAKYLVECGADPEVIINEPKNSYLMQYVTERNFKIIAFLVELGAKLEVPGDDGCTPLQKAIEMAYFQLVKYFIEKGANFEKNFNLIKYISEKKFEMVKVFVDSGVNLDFPGDDGFTALTKSVEMNDFQLVKYLVGKGVDVNFKDGNAKTALGIAASKSYFSMCKILIESGADIELAKSEVVTFRRCNDDFASFLMMQKKYVSGAANESEHEEMRESVKGEN